MEGKMDVLNPSDKEDRQTSAFVAKLNVRIIASGRKGFLILNLILDSFKRYVPGKKKSTMVRKARSIGKKDMFRIALTAKYVAIIGDKKSK